MTASGLQGIIEQYAHYGPFLAAFLANLLATFGDKGQLAVITLATKYDAKRIFVGAMAAFTAWSALEVVFGSTITRVVPASTMTVATGGLFLAFAAWTLLNVLNTVRADPLTPVDPMSVVPASLRGLTDGHGPTLTGFTFIGLAEFGDKTQLLTIALAATFPNSLVSVFLGVVAALALRTGVDALIGEQAERVLPSLYIEVASAVVFAAFGVFVFGAIGETVLIIAVVAALFFCVGAAAERYHAA
ncbi:TMEM165/GDT1 family protein [Salarchaeum japonicum]|uniref:TMEM165/GDT1 family protein n=1 Tax=Salarchaeum japonicum TaxID=555573 RepID=UPI003C78E54A